MSLFFYRMPNGSIAGHNGTPVRMTKDQFEDCCCVECLDPVCVTAFFEIFGDTTQEATRIENELLSGQVGVICKTAENRWEGSIPTYFKQYDIDNNLIDEGETTVIVVLRKIGENQWTIVPESLGNTVTNTEKLGNHSGLQGDPLFGLSVDAMLEECAE